jgi:hypothetical protein
METTLLLPKAGQNFPLIFMYIWNSLQLYEQKQTFLYLAVSRGTPNHVSRNPSWKTLP